MKDRFQLTWTEPWYVEPFFHLKSPGFICRVLLFSSQMRRCVLLPSGCTLTDLQLLFSMHLSWHSNSSTTVTVSITWPSKAWSKRIEGRNNSIDASWRKLSWKKAHGISICTRFLTNLRFKNASAKVCVCHHKSGYQDKIECHNGQLSQTRSSHDRNAVC